VLAGAVDLKIKTVSNTILLSVRHPEPVVAAMEQAARTRLTEIADGVFKQLRVVDLEAVREQVAAMPAFSWGWVEDTVGIRESLMQATELQQQHRLRVEEAQKVWKRRRNGPELLAHWGPKLLVSGKESCQVSIAHVASWSMRSWWQQHPKVQPAFQQSFQHYIARLKELDAELVCIPEQDPVLGNYDGSLLYFPKLAEVVAEHRLIYAEAALKNLLNDWFRLGRQFRLESPPLPAPYYAVIQADGGSIQGALAKGANTKSSLRAIVQTLEYFSSKAYGLISQYDGYPVYTETDSILAVLPVQRAIPYAQAISESFRALIPAELSNGISVGICVSHYGWSLASAMEGVVAARHAAKQQEGQSSWAVQLAKFRGTSLLLKGSWELLPELEPLLELQLRDDFSSPSHTSFGQETRVLF
jgi:hypothetical protein